MCYGFHANKATILLFNLSTLCIVCDILKILPYFLEIDPVHQKYCSFKYTMLKTLNSNFLECEGTLNASNDPHEFLDIKSHLRWRGLSLLCKTCHIFTFTVDIKNNSLHTCRYSSADTPCRVS